MRHYYVTLTRHLILIGNNESIECEICCLIADAVSVYQVWDTLCGDIMLRHRVIRTVSVKSV